MALNTKYVLEERKIARKIRAYLVEQVRLRKKWLELDVQISILQGQIGGKYKIKNET